MKLFIFLFIYVIFLAAKRTEHMGNNVYNLFNMYVKEFYWILVKFKYQYYNSRYIEKEGNRYGFLIF